MFNRNVKFSLICICFIFLLAGCQRKRQSGGVCEGEIKTKRMAPVSVNKNLPNDFTISIVGPYVAKSTGESVALRINSISDQYRSSIFRFDIDNLVVNIKRSDYHMFYDKNWISSQIWSHSPNEQDEKICLPYTLRIPLSKIHSNVKELKPGNYILKARIYYRPIKSKILYSNEVLLRIVE